MHELDMWCEEPCSNEALAHVRRTCRMCGFLLSAIQPRKKKKNPLTPEHGLVLPY